jgi:hypothetical protein
VKHNLYEPECQKTSCFRKCVFTETKMVAHYFLGVSGGSALSLVPQHWVPLR